ncbi:hypothetical protein ACHQM5_013563 [Ranunculus cassubicifolius]
MDARNQKPQLVMIKSDIPDDVLFNILIKLPLKTLLRFKSVSKRWHSLIQDPILIKFNSDISKNHIYLFGRDDIYLDGHLSLYSITRGGEISSVSTNVLPHCHTRVAYCNGLLCFLTEVNKTFYLCNPTTRAQIELPRSGFFSATFGFGYKPSTNKYIVVQISYWDGCHVFTLGSDSWRAISSKPANYNFYGESFFFNGALHWSGYGMIVSFDLETETFGSIPYPNTASCFFRDLHEFDGYLCMIARKFDDHNLFSLWVLKDYRNHFWVNQSFELPLIVSKNESPRVAIQNGDVLTTTHRSNPQHNHLHSYNLRSHFSTTIELPRLLSEKSVLVVGNYVQNLVSLRNM